MKKILVINSGSSTVKADVFAVENGEPVFQAKALADKIGKADGSLTLKGQGIDTRVTAIAGASIEQAIEKIIATFTEAGVCQIADIAAIGHRVVHGGSKFSAPAVINDEIIAAIREMVVFAPLHNPANLMGIRGCMAAMPGVPMVAVFDTAWGQTMPKEAYMYALPYEAYTDYKVRRYGFHGTSHRYVSGQAVKKLVKLGMKK